MTFYILLLLFACLLFFNLVVKKEHLPTLNLVGSLGIFFSLLVPFLLNLPFPSIFFAVGPHFSLSLFSDKLGFTFGVLAAFLWVLTMVYSKGYLPKELSGPVRTFYLAFTVAIFSTLGLCFSENLFSFLIFFELLTVSTYPLVIHKRSREAFTAGRKYLVYTLVGGQAVFLGLLLLNHANISTFFSDAPVSFSQFSNQTSVQVAYALILSGFCVKAALMPLHSWLPSAMVAPTPVSALLHAVAVVKAGAIGVVRLNAYVFDIHSIGAAFVNPIVIALAVFTILYSSLRAFSEDHFKRRLAYSTIGHLSYIVLGASLGNLIALTGAIYHIFAHAIMKITLFYVAGIFQVREGINYISDLKGKANTYLFVTLAFVVAALGLSGMPGSIGFLSKYHLIVGSLDSTYYLLSAVFILSGIFNLIYFIDIPWKLFNSGSSSDTNIKETTPWKLLLPPILTALLSVLLGAWGLYQLLSYSIILFIGA